MVIDLGGAGVDGVVIVFDGGEGFVADGAGEEGVGEFFELVGDVVFLVEMGFVENGVEDIGGEDVLDHHFTDILGGDGGVDHVAAEFQKEIPGIDVVRVGFGVFDDAFPEGGGDLGDVLFEELDRLAEFLHLRAFVAHEVHQDVVEAGGVPHRGAADLVSVADQHGGVAILEEDVVVWITLVEFVAYLQIEVVVFVLAFPIAPVEAEIVFEGAIRPDGETAPALDRQFRHQFQIARPGIGAQQFVKRYPDGGFVACSAAVFQHLQFPQERVDGNFAHDALTTPKI